MQRIVDTDYLMVGIDVGLWRFHVDGLGSDLEAVGVLNDRGENDVAMGCVLACSNSARLTS